jgi:hypothetical protein
MLILTRRVLTSTFARLEVHARQKPAMHGGWWPDVVPYADICGRRGVEDPDPLRMGTSCARSQWHLFCIRIVYRPTQWRSCRCSPNKCPFPSPNSRHALSLGDNALADS